MKGKWIAGVLLLTLLLPYSAAAMNIRSTDIDYVWDHEGTRLYIPKTYQVETVIDDVAGGFNNPQDIFIDAQGRIFVADTGNNRIVQMSPEHEVVAVFTGDGEKEFSEPAGVFVTEEGEIYVADTLNERVVALTAEGEKLREFVRPDSELLGEIHQFRPSKVCVADSGDLYVIMGKNFMIIDQDNAFKGFVGASNVGFSFGDFLVRLFASEEQKQKMVRAQPPAYNNFTLGENDRIYGVAQSKSEQIRIINSVGNNIYPTGVYGEQTVGASGSWVIPAYLDPSFSDIAVDHNGVISVVDKNNGRIYQYNQNGDLLTVFGGNGTVKGKFSVPSSLAVDASGRLYVLDSSANNIQIFTPTAFIEKVHQASDFYDHGKYGEAKALWEDIAAMDTGYILCEQSLGNIYYKEKDYAAAMEKYRSAGDQEGYIKAYGKYVHEALADHFVLVAIGVVALVTLLFWGSARFKRLSDRCCNDLFGIQEESGKKRRR